MQGQHEEKKTQDKEKKKKNKENEEEKEKAVENVWRRRNESERQCVTDETANARRYHVAGFPSKTLAAILSC